MDAFGKTVAVIVAVIIIFLFPLQYIAGNQSHIVENFVNTETSKLADSAMLQGYFTLEDYESYLAKLDSTGQLYDIEIIHSKPSEGYTSKNVNPISKSAKNIDSRKNVLDLFYPMEKVYASSLNKNNITNDSIHTLSTHTHSEACYAGHRHNSNCNYVYNIPAGGISGFFRRADGTIRGVYSTAELGGRFESNRLILVDNHETGVFSITEYRGGSIYYYKELTYGSGYYGDPVYISARQQLHTYLIIVENIFGYMNPNYGYGCYINPGQFPQFTVSSCSLTQDETPICNQVVTSITPTNPNQTVKKGQSIVSTADATYLDGHAGTVNCIVTGFDTNKVGTQTATLTYNGLVDNGTTNGSKTCSAIINVKDDKKPTYIQITPSSYSVPNGSEPTYTVTVFYDDGTSKIITNYEKSGFTRGVGTKTVSFSYIENNATVSTSINIIVYRNSKTCVNGHVYELNDFDGDEGCPLCKTTLLKVTASPTIMTLNKGEVLNIVLTATYLDNHTKEITSGWTSNFNPMQNGTQYVTITYEGFTDTIQVNVVTRDFTCPICGTNYTPNDDGSDPGCPVCSSLAVSIAASPQEQIVEVSKDINVTVTATFKDGSKNEVNDWTSNYNSTIVGEQQVTIYYHGVSTTVSVTVTSDTLTTCPICGTNYNPKLNPTGCPVCSKTIDKIEAQLSDGGSIVQFGSDINLSVILTYKNGNKEYANGGWIITGYNPVKLGQQVVTVHYKNLSDILTIEVINTLGKTTCVNGHVYYLNTDGSDPGCPYCAIGQDKGSSQSYYNNVYTEDILKTLYADGVYHFDKGDYITFTVLPKPISVLGKLKRMFFNEAYLDKKFSYGGLIHFGLFF